MPPIDPSQPNLPPPELARRQAAWLAPARQWLLQQANLPVRRRVLDLGCGFGSVTPELAANAGGPVVALDLNWRALNHSPTPFRDADPTCADAGRLPFAAHSFDLVLCQLALMWMPLEATLAEVRRTLMPGGVLIALEPDYGGMMEHPVTVALEPVWTAALRRAGADPGVGRKLPGALARLGFDVQVELFNQLSRPVAERFDLLKGLPLTPPELDAVAAARKASYRAERPLAADCPPPLHADRARPCLDRLSAVRAG